MPLRPILSTSRQHKLTASLLVLQAALTCAIVCNVVFMIAGRVQRISVPTGIAALGLLLYTVLHPDIRQGRAERRDGQDNGDKTNVVHIDPNRRTGS